MSDARVVREKPGVGFGVRGVAVVCCVHDVEKRKVTQLVADTSREQVSQCLCCMNLYSHDLGDPVAMRCHDCRPKGTP